MSEDEFDQAHRRLNDNAALRLQEESESRHRDEVVRLLDVLKEMQVPKYPQATDARLLQELLRAYSEWQAASMSVVDLINTIDPD